MTERIKEIRSDLRTIHQHQSESAAEQMAGALVGHVEFLLDEVARLQQYVGDLNDQIADCRVLEHKAAIARVEALAEERANDQGILSPDSRYTCGVLLHELRAALAEPERDEEVGQ